MKCILRISNKYNHAQRLWISKCSYSTATVGFEQPTDSEYENAKPFNEIPGPKGLPFIGTLLKYRKGPYTPATYHAALMETHKQYGDIFKETIAGSTVVHLFNPEYIKLIYNQEGKIPHIPPLMETTQMYREYKGMSPGLGNTNGDYWYKLRTNINQMMMRPKAVTQYLPSVNAVTGDFVQKIKEQKDPTTGEMDDFRRWILRWTLESSAMTCFETRIGALEKTEFTAKMIEANDQMFGLSLKLKFSVPWYKLMPKLSPTWSSLVKYEDFFFGNGQTLVDKTVKQINDLVARNELKEGQYGFLVYLLGKKDLLYKDLSVITLSLFADGLSTTSPTTMGQLYCIARNTEVQEKLYEEIRRIAPDKEKPVTAEMLNKASYLKACIKEGFRFFPIGTEVSRIPQKNMVIGNYQVPSGTVVQLNNNMLLRSPEYFEDPNTYVPERWLRDGSGQNIHPYLLLPFGFGPRTCAGRRFAEQDMQVLIIKLLQNFRLEWTHSHEMKQKYKVLLTPDVQPQIKFVPR